MTHVWSPAKYTKKVREWLVKPENRSRLLDKSMVQLEELAAGSSPDRLVAHYNYPAVWYEMDGLNGIMSGADGAIEALNLAAYLRTLYLRSTAIRLAMLPTANLVTVNWNDSMNAFALAIALGRWEDARDTADAMGQANSDLFLAFNFTAVGSFIVNLYSRWAAEPLSDYLSALKVNEVYARVLSTWDSEDVQCVQNALIAACDYHAERSRWSTNKETFEFDNEFLALMPSEILAVLRLRETRGLAIPVLDHPVMNTPAGKLYPAKTIVPDPIFDASYSAIVRNIEARAARAAGEQ